MDEETALRHLLEVIDGHLLALETDGTTPDTERRRRIALFERARVSVQGLLDKLLQPTQ